jgi:hypothetical protein
MTKKLLITQSNYIPWKGYFDAINSVDVFVVYDVVQYTKNDWRNRNLIKTQKGKEWLTIPIRQEQLDQKIMETKIAKHNWYKKHWSTLQTVYGKAPYFKEYKAFFEALYLKELKDAQFLSEINLELIKAILKLLGSRTKVISAKALLEDLKFDESLDRNARLIDICKKLEVDTYYSGPAAKVYLDEAAFEAEGIKVEWLDYSNYPEYPQLYGDFEHGVSILDLIFNTGAEAKKYMKSFKDEY